MIHITCRCLFQRFSLMFFAVDPMALTLGKFIYIVLFGTITYDAYPFGVHSKFNCGRVFAC